MKLTKTRLKALVELMDGSVPEGFEERVMADYGPGSDWAKALNAKCPPGAICDFCEVEYCNAGWPTTFEMIVMTYEHMRDNPPPRYVDEERRIPF